MKTSVVAGVLFSSMWHGYRRWMTVFNILSIVLSVMLATVITAFSSGVHRYIRHLVRTEAAAGAVRTNYGDVLVVDDKMTFAEADLALRRHFDATTYDAYNLWWRSESHQLMLHNPLDLKRGGIYTSLGNTFIGDPEAERVEEFCAAGGWITSDDAAEIVLTLTAARALLQQLPELHDVSQLIGRDIWLALPGTLKHDPAASARVRITGVYAHLRDSACMTTAGTIQKMYSRILANANGARDHTYDRMRYRLLAITPLDNTASPVQEHDARLAGEDIPLLCLRVHDLTERALYPMAALRESLARHFPEVLRVEVAARDATNEGPFFVEGRLWTDPPGEVAVLLDELASKHPKGALLCSPRLWNELGYEAAPAVFTDSWKPEAHYAYYYFSDLDAAREGRRLLQRWGLATYMPIDRFAGLIKLVHVATISAGALLLVILTAGTLGIVVTLYTEVDAGAHDIGLLKALGASNSLVGVVFLLKGALIGFMGALLGIPAGILLDSRLNQRLSDTIAEQAGLGDTASNLFYHDPWLMTAIVIGIVLLAAAAAITPSLLAARRDPQEALREE
ncbi:MAG: FtsX-like permease family protein [Spartobacteria bacterium]|nr:FtsX-like permease family protein [Spartobacteria bacterium]